jgi:hypothetical protein
MKSSIRWAGAAVCPENLPRARRRYLEGLCLRLFVCAGVSGQVAEHGCTRIGRICTDFFSFFLFHLLAPHLRNLLLYLLLKKLDQFLICIDQFLLLFDSGNNFRPERGRDNISQSSP